MGNGTPDRAVCRPWELNGTGEPDPARGAARQRGARDGAGLPGLVSFTTSVTHPPSSPQEPPEEINRVFRSGTINQDGSQEITLYRHEGRLKRMRGSVRASAELLHQEAHTGGHRTRAVLVTLTYRPDVDWGT